jgi:hypothetical protein
MEQVADNILGLGSPKYDNAYWQISYLRIYIASDLAATSGTATPPVTSASQTLNTPVVSSPLGISSTSSAQVSRRLPRNLTTAFIAVIIGYLF